MFQVPLIDHVPPEASARVSSEISKLSALSEPSEPEIHALKPMNCPSHCLIYASRIRSYRELPIRLADFGVLHRNEFSGALRGLTRVRRFCQDDAHIFCREDQIEAEIEQCLDFLRYVYGIFQFPAVAESGQNFQVELSTRPDNFIGAMETWNRAEAALSAVLTKRKLQYTINAGEGAFYGPKLDIHIKDVMGRSHQCATIQLDFQLPAADRMNLEYVTDVAGVTKRPVIIHRAIFGSLERFMAILMEHFQGKWPLWLSPRQVMVIPVKPNHVAYANSVVQAVQAEDVYVDLDSSDETLDKKIFRAQDLQYNYIMVVGNREEAAGTVSLRHRSGQQSVLPLVEAVNRLKREVATFQ
jgi:threonyl-tRNA synthetase